MSEENKSIIRRFVEILNSQDLDALGEVWAEDLVWHGSAAMGGDVHGLEAFTQLAAPFLAAFPDLHTTIEDLIAEGDKVVARVTARGNHKGEFVGIPPTGKQVEMIGTHIYRIAGGKIAEEWWLEDMMGLMQQLGVVPPPGESGA